MSLSALRQRSAWGALERHYQKMADRHLRQLFAEDRERGERFTVEAAGVYLDYSKNRITDETVKLLLQLAQESGLRERGASAPLKELQRKFGFEPERVVAAAKEVLGRG